VNYYVEMKSETRGKPIVFVHLGLNPTPTLIHFSRLAKGRLNNPRLFLISDHPDRFRGFPGQVIQYKNKHPAIRELERTFPHYKNISGGYWIRTIERLFALDLMKEVLETDESFLHFESDVMSLVTDDIYDLLDVNYEKVAYPRFSKQAGIASILYSPSAKSYEEFLNALFDIVIKAEGWMTDMDLLGIVLNNKDSEELPSCFPVSSFLRDQDGNQVIFDGAALGQYLFGRDPVHTKGKSISGYTNPHFDIDLGKSRWSIKNCESGNKIFISCDENQNMRVANLHVHSKQLIPNMDANEETWIQIMKAANREIPPLEGEYVEDLIHKMPVPFRDKVSRAFEKGIYSVLKEKTRNTLLRKNE
jgi:hypothetical protein